MDLDSVSAKVRYIGIAMVAGPTFSWLLRQHPGFQNRVSMFDHLPSYDPNGFSMRHPGWAAIATLPFGVAAVVVALGIARKLAWARAGLEILAWLGAAVCIVLAVLWGVAAIRSVGPPPLALFRVVAVLMSSVFAVYLVHFAIVIRRNEVRVLFTG